ncbi:hypothetical protein L1267_10895 [Pseudoalteromonas sp. OFAV1]|uniref:hypothetical protein n=1 Tax=Pseudoalteromonas sp. OFAV1 TaxID=2908892 RepID=UPI001F44E94E|nr:hypothetical protein [Pseudoalteromonas sp. OFAV1]MCF2900910.1 hypothetical protein [Pseudoalteromonas sp. OFAV1]
MAQLETDIHILPQEVSNRIVSSYFRDQEEAFKCISKNSESFFSEYTKKIDDSNPEVMEVSLPRRKRWLGMLPISVELGLMQELNAVLHIIDALSQPDARVGNIATFFAKNSSDVRRYISGVNNYFPEMNTNLAGIDHIFFSHRFEMLGAPFFSVTDTLVDQLLDVDIGKSAECHFLKCPHPIQYIEFGQSPLSSIEIFNNSSGMHSFEGMYVNEIILTQVELDREIDTGNLLLSNNKVDNRHNMTSHALETGYINKGSGDVHILEILATGSPQGKESNFDDATLCFTIMYQDDTKSVSELIDWHTKYFKKILPTQTDIVYQDEFDGLNINRQLVMSDTDGESMIKIIEALAKSLLYINSENAIRESISERKELKLQLKRLQNKAKKRKVEKKLGTSFDYTRIGPVNLSEQASTNIDELITKKPDHSRSEHSKQKACWELFVKKN